MLRRLLNSRSSLDLDTTTSTSNSTIISNSSISNNNIQIQPNISKVLNSDHTTSISSSSFTNEDSLSRTVLYGTPNHLNSQPLDPKLFRFLIVEDSGKVFSQADNYKILFNTSNNNNDINYLLEYMFGNPIYQDLNRLDQIKFRHLNKNSILITNTFYISKKRFAIGMIIPVKFVDFPSYILSNWHTVTKYLHLIKLKFISFKDEKPNSSNNWQNIYIIFKQFVKSLNYLILTPRLLLGVLKFDSVFDNWCFEINNWIEIKDGWSSASSSITTGSTAFSSTRSTLPTSITGTKFLTTLISIVYGIKEQLVSMKSDKSEFVRIVIMAANPIVAQKLIFIISGFLPQVLDFKIEDVNDLKPSLSESKQSHDDDTDTETERSIPVTPSIVEKKGWEIPKTPSKSITTPPIMTMSKPSTIHTLSKSQSMAYLSSSLSQSQSSTFSNSLTRGFQYLSNWKNSLDSNNSSISVSSIKSKTTPSPNSVLEFEEYPWSGLNTHYNNLNNNYVINDHLHSHTNHHHHVPRSDSYHELSMTPLSITKLNKRTTTIPKLPFIDRDTTTLFQVGSSQSTFSQLTDQTRDACFKLMQSKPQVCKEFDDLKNVSVLDVSLDDDDDDDDDSNDTNNEQEDEAGVKNTENHTLPLLSGYVNEYIPEFQLQACPISQDLESKIVSSMKDDLVEYSNSKTILVSLRAREIREIQLNKIDQSSLQYKSNVKKLYYNSRPSSSSLEKVNFDKIDQFLMKIVGNFQDFHDEEGGSLNDLKDSLKDL